MRREYDVVIVGARVAGASLGLLLGQRGRRILMIDRDTFPSETLSTHFVSGQGILAMRKLGILGDLIEAGFRKITRSRTWVDDCMLEGPSGPKGTFALAPGRDTLDATVIQHAVERGGVEFLDRTTMESLITEGDRVVGVVARTSDGEKLEVHAQVVVGADGKYSKVAQLVKAECYEEFSGLRPVYYGHFTGVQSLNEPAVELLFTDNTIGFLFPMRPNEDCLALEIQPEEFAAFRMNPQVAFEERYRALPGMAARMTHAQLTGKLQGVRSVDNYLRKPYGPGWALAGDAGYLKDPSTGLGIGDALYYAFGLADALDSALNGADWEASMSAYQRARDESALPIYRWTLGATKLRDTPTSSIAWIQALMANPHHARQMLYWLPSAIASHLPPQLREMNDSMARYFDAQ